MAVMTVMVAPFTAHLVTLHPVLIMAHGGRVVMHGRVVMMHGRVIVMHRVLRAGDGGQAQRGSDQGGGESGFGKPHEVHPFWLFLFADTLTCAGGTGE
jgi:hypothetical protein